MPIEESAPAWTPLNARERRVLGVMVEKQKTTPEYYPMSIAAIATACNQKNNRDPISNYDPDDVEETLHELRKKGAAVMVEGSGRVTKWKHGLYDWFGLRNRPAEMAVLAELMLRGKQTEGDLRGRASRMEPIADLETLQALLKTLQDMNLVIYLTPPEVRRGAVVTHNLYPPAELQRVKEEFARLPMTAEVESRPARSESPDPGWRAEFATLRSELDALRSTVESLSAELRELKTGLGA